MTNSSSDRRGSYAFGRFRLSADGTLLLRDGARVALAPKVLHTLLVLVERAGQVVRKADILQAVWPDSFVEETGLTRNISLLRQALADDAQTLIVTVARIGYRFAAPVVMVDTPTASTPTGDGLARTRDGGPDGNDGRTETVGEQGRRRDMRGERGGLIVGRDAELDTLWRAFQRARQGPGRLIAIAGEPGIGKTTVVEAFLGEVRGACLAVRGRCSERLAGTEPHLSILEALDEVLAAQPSFAWRAFAP